MWHRVNLNVAQRETIKQLSHTLPQNRIYFDLGVILLAFLLYTKFQPYNILDFPSNLDVSRDERDPWENTTNCFPSDQ